MSTDRILAIALAVACFAAAGQPAEGLVLVDLEITTKSGVRLRPQSGLVYHSFLKEPYSEFKLQLGGGVDLLIPWRLLKEAVAEKGMHAVTLCDGCRYVGTIPNSMTVSHKPSALGDWEEYRLCETSQFRLMNAARAATSKNPSSKPEIMTVRIDCVEEPFSVARFEGFHGKTGEATFRMDPLDSNKFTITFDEIKERQYGETFQADVHGERVNGKLTSYEKFVLAKSEESEEWQLTLQEFGAKPVEGRFLPGNEQDRPSLSSWWMRFQTTSGCTLVATEPTCTISISMKHGPAQAPAQRAIVPGATVVVSEDGARFMLGEKVIAELPQQTEVEVTEIRGDWVGGYGELEGRRVSGWVKREQVRTL